MANKGTSGSQTSV
ncbi:hypothetical protein VULLAG_LOCUS5126 [Vulpes lagopus]